MVKNYGIHDIWTDLDKVNDVDIKAVDGVIDSIKVNGEEAGGGGGGGDYPTITATWHADTETYTYSCNWSFAEVKAKLEENSESNTWAGIIIDTSNDGSTGGTWGIANNNILKFDISDQISFDYHSDGTITEEII